MKLRLLETSNGVVVKILGTITTGGYNPLDSSGEIKVSAECPQDILRCVGTMSLEEIAKKWKHKQLPREDRKTFAYNFV